jgi:hypothetical protein
MKLAKRKGIVKKTVFWDVTPYSLVKVLFVFKTNVVIFIRLYDVLYATSTESETLQAECDEEENKDDASEV